MKWYLKLLLLPIFVLNLLVALLLIGCAYSPMLPAEDMPLLSLSGLAFPFVLGANIVFLLIWFILYRPFMLLPLVTCALCFPQIRALSPINFSRQRPKENSIKVVSYNILSSNLKKATANKENPTIAYLESTGADIICLQEFPFAAIKGNADAKKLFSEYPYKSYMVSDDSELSAHFLACLSKYPILSVDKLEFNSTSNGCTRYRILHEADTIVVYNCHLQSNSLNADNKSSYEELLANPKGNINDEATKELVKKLREATAKRAAQAAILMADVSKQTSPYVIVCGDFNDSPISYTRKLLTEALDDAYVNSGNGPGFSYNRNKMYYRIDHILHSRKFKSYACIVDRTITTSDHYPISCYLEKTK